LSGLRQSHMVPMLDGPCCSHYAGREVSNSQSSI